MDLPTLVEREGVWGCVCVRYALSLQTWKWSRLDWPSMTQMKNSCHTCWFWARWLSGSAFIQDSHVRESYPATYLPISASAVLVFRSHRLLIEWRFSLSYLFIMTKVFLFDPVYVWVGKMRDVALSLPLGFVLVVIFRSWLTRYDPWCEAIPPAFVTVEY